MGEIDKQYLKTPFYGSRRMAAHLKKEGYQANRKRVQRLMGLMGIQAIYPKAKSWQKRHEHKIYPYLLEGLTIDRPNMVWSSDITYIPLGKGFLYLVAIIDWYSRYVIAWRLSNSMDTSFCIDALTEALKGGFPEIFNTDQGSQFTSTDFTNMLLDKRIKISMDGKGRCFDNIFIERLWRTVKYEEVYLKAYETVEDAEKGLYAFFPFYNLERPHQALEYKTPKEVHFA